MNALICITSCNRLQEVKKYILPYIDFCNKNQEYDFLLSLDGNNQEYIDFCKQYQIPLLYSDEREGVGLSKNRVLKQFPSYDFYFFIDDDVELINASIFQKHIQFSQKLNIHHFSVTSPRQIIETKSINETTIIYALFGGAYFNFFTNEGLKKVGGWHTLFAKYKRYGHTEHSYRYFHQQLSPAPFVIIKDCLTDLILHNPLHVTDANVISNQNQLIDEEQKIIDQKISFFPLTTLCFYHFNGCNMNFNQTVSDYLFNHPRKYPLISGKEKNNCMSEYFFYKFEISKNFFQKIIFFICSFIYKWNNLKLKHWLKTKINFTELKYDKF